MMENGQRRRRQLTPEAQAFAHLRVSRAAVSPLAPHGITHPFEIRS